LPAFLVPQRGSSTAADGGFLTRPDQNERLYYAVEITQLFEDENLKLQLGPLMAPVIDDVTIYYMPRAAARVLEEREVIGD
jgi:hypothetical protein